MDYIFNKKEIIFEILILIILSIFLCFATGGLLFAGDINVIDEGQFGAWATQMLLGKHMYKDIYITYGPLYIYPLFLLFKVFGPSAFLVRLYLTLTSIIALLIANLLLVNLRVKKLIRYSTLLTFFLFPIAQYRIGLGLLDLYFLYQVINSESKIWQILLGIGIVFCLLVSPEIGIFITFITILYFIFAFIFTNKIKNLFFKSGGVFLSFFLASVVFIIWAGSEMWLISYLLVTKDIFVTFSGINLPNGQNFPSIISLIPDNLNIFTWIKFVFSKEMLLYYELTICLVGFFYIVFHFFTNKISNKFFLFSALVIYGFFVYSLVISRSGIGHFFFSLSPVVIASSVYISELSDAQKALKIKGKLICFSIIFVFIILVFRVITIERIQYKSIIQDIALTFNPKHNPPYVGPISISSGQKNYIKYVQTFVNKNTNISDSVFFVNNEPVMYMLVNRKNATRYDLPYIADTQEKRFEIIDDLKKNKPPYIFENISLWAVDGVSNRQRMPEVMSYISKNYILYLKKDSLNIYKIKS